MKVSNRRRSINKVSKVSPEYASANDVPLTEERLAILGHEIRNPLSALSYALQTWPSTMDDPQLTEDLLQVMRRQVLQLTRLSNDLLDLGKLDQGKMSICRNSLDIKNVIQHACEELRPFIDQCGQTMTVAVGDLPSVMLGDESRLTQVFANLMHNSAKFTQHDGHLHVSLDREHDTAVIRLSDNGCGMCSDQLQKLFSAEYDSWKNSEAPQAGLGIGLRLAKSIVELHGGTIQGFSDGLGCGSTFVVRLPTIADISTKKTSACSLPIGASCQGKTAHLPSYRVLVVDDDRSMRFFMSQMLEKLHQSVTMVDDGDSAMELIGQLKPQVVFLDLQMHGLSGFDVARLIRGRTEFNKVALIALSGNSDAASRRLAAESGFDQYLVKPTSLTELSEALARIVADSTDIIVQKQIRPLAKTDAVVSSVW